MTTARDLIQASLEQLGVYSSGETVSDADIERGLWVLNGMLDAWSIESLMCFAILEQSGALVPGKTAYTIGTGGNFNMSRPQDIIEGYGAAYLQDALGNNFPVNVVQKDQWNGIGNRTTTSNIPDTLFYDSQMPLGIINIFPTPLLNYTLFWDSYTPLTQFANLSTVMNFPPGYQDAIQFNLTVRMKPYFNGAQLDPDIKELARETKGNIKRANIKPVEAVYANEIVAKGAGSYNIYRDNRS
ncbi:MAG: hypothetical protein KGP14_01810 [Betaproteobacteria bacterium]|nr:hypothetical protein [Betaproteobacteria bacterium]